jgi:hypothetical protein
VNAQYDIIFRDNCNKPVVGKFLTKRRNPMKAGIIFTGSGPILVLTSYDSFIEEDIVEKLRTKGIKKYVVRELPLETVKKRYGQHYHVVLGDLKQTDDLRVLDYNGHNVFYNFSFREMGPPLYYESEGD